MQQLQRQIDEVGKQIKAEMASIKERIREENEATLREHESLQARVTELKSEILSLHDRSTEDQVLKREVDTNRELYDGLLQRIKEVGVVAGISTNNISIVDRALVPGAPYTPNLQKNLSISLAIGLLLGIALAYLLEHLDDSLKTTEDVEGRVRAPVLGVVPFAASRDYDSSEADVALLAAKHPTSAGFAEGKTTVAPSIAVAFAHAGASVLLIDADLRSPSLHHVFSLPNALGLTNYLAGDSKPADIAQPTLVERLFAVTSGPLPPNPVELLASTKMLNLMGLAEERFDYVIIDGPPILGLADAVVLSRLAQGTIFVTDAQRTRYRQLEGAVKRLYSANAYIVGAVINRLGRAGNGYGYGYGYSYDYRYHYEYGVRDRTSALPENA